jgi:thiol-disulfide isomerase/thioredoxin
VLFLTNDYNLSIKDNLLYFYFGKDINCIDEILSKIMIELDKIYDIICIDMAYFHNLHKRYDIKEIPTILIFKDGQEIKRINGFPSINDINLISLKA